MATETIDSARRSGETDYLTRMMDTDSHEMVPLQHWGRVFDEGVAGRLQRANMAMFADRQDANAVSRPDLKSDEGPITRDTVWALKGPGAPSAIDLERRPAVMDEMGILRQLLFPTFGTIGQILLYQNDPGRFMGFDPTALDYRTLGRDIITVYNRWVARVTQSLGDRVRPCWILMPDTIETMMSGVEEALALGVKAVLLPAGIPPGGTSPADQALDPFWSLLEDANVPALVHIGTEFALMASPKWSVNVPEFVPSLDSSAEFPMEPYRASIMHYAADQYLVTMIMGGVFERHPRLRFGVLEMMADWVGPLAERLDIIFDQFKRLRTTLSMRPSEYFPRNVRVAPFTFEPVDAYLSRHPVLRDVLCYSSDYPHVEGGKFSHTLYQERLSGFPDEVSRKFFVDNGELLLPA